MPQELYNSILAKDTKSSDDLAYLEAKKDKYANSKPKVEEVKAKKEK